MRLAWKELTHSWKKYLLISIIVILMMFMVLFLSGLVDGLGRAVSGGIEKVEAGTFLLKEDAEGLITVSSVTEEQFNEVSEKADGEATTIDIMRMYLNKEGSEEKIDVAYFAVDPESMLAPEVFEGVTLKESDAENPIVLDDDFAYEGIKVGDSVYDAATELAYTVVGFTKDAMYGHVSIGYVSVDTFTKMMSTLNPEYEKAYHAIVLEKENADLQLEGLERYSKSEIIDSIPGYKSEQVTINMVDWMLVVITAAVLAIFFFVINLQKEKEFGVLKALGMSMWKLAGFVICEIGIVSIFGAVVSAALVFAMSRALPGTMPFYLKAENVAIILAAFVAISLLGSLLSILKVRRIDPAEIIGGDN